IASIERLPLIRHCERSEAISSPSRTAEIASSPLRAPRNDTSYLLHPQPRLLRERRPVRQLFAEELVHAGDFEIHRHQRLLGEILLDAGRMDRLAHCAVELLDDRLRQPL